MPPIQNPRYSRPLDVHRWSDHPEVKGMVDDLWDGGLKERFEGKKSVDGRAKPGPKPKADHKVCPGHFAAAGTAGQRAELPV
ncbi:hypothetical protein CEW88_04465 [Alloyangia pacifica]|uniref:Uncharacterized protein n=1 Tax=Alloyangia pacifica TaxID=311180 RepID=A0A2U8HAI5_9RHOB|nr:hypothetical protein CEW88_04465 [Alloyangia pacifica]